MLVKTITEKEEEIFLKMNEKFYTSEATKRGYDEGLSKKTFNYLMSKHENLWGYFIMHDENIIGYALITSYWCNEEGGSVIILDELFIDNEYRHHGNGKMFLSWLEKEFKGKATSVSLEVLSTNLIAKKLYTEEGLVEDDFITLSKKI